MKIYDVAVIGGGPVGSQAAYRLAALGHEVAVVEKKASIDEPVCCTGIISQECVGALALDHSVILRQASGARIFSPSGKLLNIRRAEPQASIVDRPALNMALASRAKSLGVDYIMNSPITGISVDDNGVRVDWTNRGTASSYLRARAVIIAAGFNIRLAENLGLGRFGDFVMGAQAEVETIGLDDVEVYMGREIAPGFFAWIVPSSPGKALAGLLSRRSSGAYLKKFLALLLKRGKIISSDVKASHRGIPLQPLAKTYSDRLVVVGSAAGHIKPTTGGGIYYGVLAADIAADALHQALGSDNLSAKNLSSYQREWRKKLGTELRVGYWARKLYESFSDRQIDRIFDLVESRHIHETLLGDPALSFDWHSSVVLRVAGHQALSRVFEAFALPSMKHRGKTGKVPGGNGGI
ncbi:MAG: NAD(P)/FAD-dependent oxidoreductase [Chloroflexi bacterium]|nr:NAD(P)/FAD-dependent oxidoreductase [Chloroflexota bacterium]